MLAIEVELLTGRYVATAHNDRSRAEWPPHPARFFSALVAALHDHDPVDPAERSALLWLEQQSAPQLDVDLGVDEMVGRRQVRSVFVPVNDVTLVGDPEIDLREARSKLMEMEESGSTRAASAEIKKAQKVVEREEKKLTIFLEAQQMGSTSPSKEDLKRAVEILPDRRNRQERTFPVVVPIRTTFIFFWDEADPAKHLGALRRLCDRVTRLGHSSSLVRCTIVTRAIKPTLAPQEDGEHILRIFGPGQLVRLEEAYERHQAIHARVLPGRPLRYGQPEDHNPIMPCSVFTSDWIIFERVGGQRPLASRGADLAISLRRALIEIHAEGNLPPILSGHDVSGGKAIEPHVAFVPLPWVGHEHADGSVQGLAIVAPGKIARDEREELMRVLAKWETERGDIRDDYAIELGTPSGFASPIRVRFRRVEVPSKAALHSARWCKPSYRFITATPIALDRHPGNLRSNTEHTAHRAATEAESTIADACERIGLPRPTSVSVSLEPLLSGAQHVRQYTPWPRVPGKTRRARVHAEIVFSERVRGPVIVGAGRHFGLGLCLPITESPEERTERRTT